jgi:ankyrin repeat protein
LKSPTILHTIVESIDYPFGTRNGIINKISGDVMTNHSIQALLDKMWSDYVKINPLALKVFNENNDIINVNIINNDNDSLLLLSVVNGMKKLALKIIEKINVEIVNKPNSFNDTVLLLAINLQYWDIVAKLIEKKDIDLNHINKNGDNALILLINSNQWDLVEKILNNPHIDKYHKNRLTAIEMLNGSNGVHLLKYF